MGGWKRSAHVEAIRSPLMARHGLAVADRRHRQSAALHWLAANHRGCVFQCYHLQDKAHKLGDIVVRQEAATRELQRQLAAVQDAQAAALAAATGEAAPAAPPSPQQLSAMREQLALAQAALAAQAAELKAAQTDYERRKGLLKEAAGAARREVLALQEANAQLQGVADHLQQQNGLLNAQLREACSRPGSASSDAGLGSLGSVALSAGPSPAKRHMDSAMLAAMLRKQDGWAAAKAAAREGRRGPALHGCPSAMPHLLPQRASACAPLV